MRLTPRFLRFSVSMRLLLPIACLLLLASSGFGWEVHGHDTSGQAHPGISRTLLTTQPDSTEAERLEALFWERQRASKDRFTEADESFMVGMIAHHSQALIMTELARTNHAGEGVMQMARRIENTQIDEIDTMQQWLRDRALPVPIVSIDGIDMRIEMEMPEHTGSGDGHAMGEPEDAASESGAMQHGMHHDAPSDMSHHRMPGMLTRDQLAKMAEATESDFDELFLRYMIEHHLGAVYMVQELLAAEGAAQHPETFRLASDIHADQQMEIERMGQMLQAMGGPLPDSLEPDPPSESRHEH